MKVGIQWQPIESAQISGRLQLDTYRFFLREGAGYKSKALGKLARDILGPEYGKENVSVGRINRLQTGDATTRRTLALYCLKVRVIAPGSARVQTPFSWIIPFPDD